MRISYPKFAITAAILATTLATYSAFAHEDKATDMMSSNGMPGMGGMMGMMNMMSDISPEDRKAMTEACMKMMQGHGGDGMHGGMKDKGTDEK